jgi:hypothetical protein
MLNGAMEDAHGFVTKLDHFNRAHLAPPRPSAGNHFGESVRTPSFK